MLENVGDECNVAAILRTAEGLGIQHVHKIESINSSSHYQPTGRKVGRRALSNVAMGAGRWLSINHYRSPIDCITRLRELDLRILASDCPPCEADVVSGFATASRADEFGEADARPIDAAMVDHAAAGVAIVFGNEKRGVSRAFVERADQAFYLPMAGLTQSFNISVAVAMTLYAVIASGHPAAAEGSLTEEERMALLGRWLLRDVKAAKQILRAQAQLDFDDH